VANRKIKKRKTRKIKKRVKKKKEKRTLDILQPQC
jgi:hypothetical protein